MPELPPLPPPLCIDMLSGLPASRPVSGAHQLSNDADFWERHEELCVLGKGYFGKVVLARESATGRLAAVKIVYTVQDQYCDVDYRREPEILGSVNHPNIVQLIDVYQTPTTLFILMEPHMGGDLLMHTQTLPGGVCSEAQAHRHVLKLLLAVEHIHSRGIVHRDIKPANVLLSEDGLELRLADFGLSEALPASGLLSSVCGTHDFLAPEMILCGRGDAPGYDTAVDMWSIGLLLFVLLYGHNPFEHSTEIETLQAILVADFSFPECAEGSTPVSTAARDLIRRLLVPDPSQRLTAAQCLQHEWIVSAGTLPKAVAARLHLASCRNAVAQPRVAGPRSVPPCARSRQSLWAFSGIERKPRHASSGAIQVQ